MAGILFGRNKKFLLGFLAIVFFASGFWIIQTQTTEAQPTSTLLINPLKCGDIICLIDTVVDFIFYIAVPLVVLMIVLGASLFMTAGGEPQKITAARNVILYALIGLLVIILAGALITALKYAMGVP